MEDIFNALLNVRVKTRKGSYLPNKPLMLLVALARCQQGKNRLAPFYIYEKSLGLVYREFGNLNAVFPFGRLPADGIWEIPGDAELHRNKSGDLIRSELITKSVLGGFPAHVYEALSVDRNLLMNIAIKLLEKYISPEQFSATVLKFGLSLPISDRIPMQSDINIIDIT